MVGVTGLIAMALMIVGAGTATMQMDGEADWPVVQATTKVDPAEVNAIKAVMERSYELKAVAGQTYDVSQFDTVYTNDLAVPLHVEQAKFLDDVRAKQGSNLVNLPGMSTNGWLAFKTAQTLNSKRGAEAVEQIETKAQAEGRVPNTQDYDAVTGVVGMPAPPQSITGGKANIVYQEIKVSGIYAEVVYEDGAALARALLVKTQAGWRIAGIRPIDIHF
jgi:hypothetical protein